MGRRYVKSKRIWVLGVAALVLYNCATAKQTACTNADWRQIGIDDGARGYGGSRIDHHRHRCAAHKITPDIDLYERGRRRGLQRWCSPANGYRLGAMGKSSHGVCPESLAPAFQAALAQGRALYAYEKESEIQARRLKEMKSELTSKEANIQTLEKELTSRGVSPRRRMKLLDEIRRAKADRQNFSHQIDDMTQTIQDMRDNLDRMRARPPFPLDEGRRGSP